jgi:predicted RNase H-like HicB family nuclease
MSIHLYFAVFRVETDGGYSVSFPDVPGVITEGDTFADALQNAKDALETALDFMAAEGLPLPQARSPEAILLEANSAPIAAIEAETATNSVRVNVSFDERLLARIDRAADQTGQTRSGFLARAARELLASNSGRGASLRVVSREDDGYATLSRRTLAFGASTALSTPLTRSLDDISNCLRLEHSAGGLLATAQVRQLHGFGDEICGPFFMLRSTAETLFAFGPAGPNQFGRKDDETEFQHS